MFVRRNRGKGKGKFKALGSNIKNSLKSWVRTLGIAKKKVGEIWYMEMITTKIALRLKAV